MPPLILDGRNLAERRLPALRSRANSVREARGTPPCLLLVAVRDPGGRVPWIARKVRAGARAGVEVRSLVLEPDLDTTAAVAALERATGDTRPNGILLQFPFPPGIDLDVLSAAVPLDADVDAMKPERFRAFMAGKVGRPPATVAATLALLDEAGVALGGREGVAVAEERPFTSMLCEALTRRGARIGIASPDSKEFGDRLRASTLVVTAAHRAGIVRSSELAPGSVVVDGGYFNPGGVGDLDVSDGVDHLEALAPVPGGVGPMTISTLLEAVIEAAEKRER